MQGSRQVSVCQIALCASEEYETAQTPARATSGPQSRHLLSKTVVAGDFEKKIVSQLKQSLPLCKHACRYFHLCIATHFLFHVFPLRIESVLIGGVLHAARVPADPWSREYECLDLHERLPQIRPFLRIDRKLIRSQRSVGGTRSQTRKLGCGLPSHEIRSTGGVS